MFLGCSACSWGVRLFRNDDIQMKIKMVRMDNTDYANTDKIFLSDDTYKIAKCFYIKVDILTF